MFKLRGERSYKTFSSTKWWLLLLWALSSALFLCAALKLDARADASQREREKTKQRDIRPPQGAGANWLIFQRWRQTGRRSHVVGSWIGGRMAKRTEAVSKEWDLAVEMTWRWSLTLSPKGRHHYFIYQFLKKRRPAVSACRIILR